MYSESIFFSYNRSDIEFALKLARDLRENGVNVWLDKLDIPGGVHWDNAIEKALFSSTCILVIISPAAIESSNVMDEVSYALEEKKKLIPVIFKESAIPYRLRRLQHIVFTGDYQEALDQLLQSLAKSDISKEPISPTIQQEPIKHNATQLPESTELLNEKNIVETEAATNLEQKNTDRFDSNSMSPQLTPQTSEGFESQKNASQLSPRTEDSFESEISEDNSNIDVYSGMDGSITEKRPWKKIFIGLGAVGLILILIYFIWGNSSKTIDPRITNSNTGTSSSGDSFVHVIDTSAIPVDNVAKPSTSQPPESDNSEERPSSRLEVEAEFPGGLVAWRKFLEQNLNPNVPIDSGAKAGTYIVQVQFTVDKQGNVSDITPITKNGFGMEEEVVRVIKSSGKWSPATQNGRIVKSYKKQPVTFRIEEETKKTDKKNE